MARSLFIFGAGGSYDSGFPLTGDYLNKISRDLNRHGLPESAHVNTPEKRALENFVGDLRSFFGAGGSDNQGIEQLTRDFFSDLKANPKKYDRPGYAKTVIYQELMSYPLVYPDPLNCRNYYRDLLRGIATGNIDFISINQDALIDKALLAEGVSFNYGIPLTILDEGGSVIGNHRGLSNNTGSVLLKPNGSLTWFVCPICNSVFTSPVKAFPFDPSCKLDESFNTPLSTWDFFTYYYTRGSYGLRCPNDSKILRYTIFHPYLLDYNTFLTERSGELLSAAYNLVSACGEIFSIGYSFPQTDPHIIRALESGLRDNANNPLLSIISSNYESAKTIATRLKGVLRYNRIVAYDATGFSDFITRYNSR